MQLKDIATADVLRAINEKGIDWLHDAAFKGVPLKLICAKALKLADRGLLEYGVSLRFPWLTPEGKQALDALSREGDS